MMTPEELKEAEIQKVVWLEEIKNRQSKIAELHQQMLKVEDQLNKAKHNYSKYDRKIAMQEHYTLCPPAGSKELKKTRAKQVGICQMMTKEEALKLIQELDV